MGASNSKSVWDLMRRPTHDNCKAFLTLNFGSPEQIKHHVSNLESLSVKIGESRLVQVLNRVVGMFKNTVSGGSWFDLGITKDEMYSLILCIGLGWLFLYAYHVLDTQKDLMVMLFKVLTGWKTTVILTMLSASFDKWENPFKHLFYALFNYVFGISSNVLHVFKKIVAVVNKLMFKEPANPCEICKAPQELVRVECGDKVHMVHPGCYTKQYLKHPGQCPVCKTVLTGDDAPDD